MLVWWQALLLTLLVLYFYGLARLLLPTLAPPNPLLLRILTPCSPCSCCCRKRGTSASKTVSMAGEHWRALRNCTANRLLCPATMPCSCRPGSLLLLVIGDAIAPAHGLSLRCRLAKPFRVEEFARVRRGVRCSVSGRWPTPLCAPPPGRTPSILLAG